MQYCLNLNPTIDKTLEFAEFTPGGTNRPDKVRAQAGGKPINTALVLKALGGDPKVVGLVYRSDAAVIENALETESIFYDFHERDGVSRINLKIVDKSAAQVTEINETGQPVEKELLGRIADELVGMVFEGDTVILSGRLPEETPDDYYADLITRLKAKEVRTVLDTSGTPLLRAAAARPSLIKPNLPELEQLTGKKLSTLDDAVRACEDVRKQYGIRIVVVSFGKYGALAVGHGELAYASGMDIPVGSTVGAGDSLVAGLLVREESTLVEMLKSGMAAAAGSVSLPGTDLCTPELYTTYLDQVVIEEAPDLTMPVR